MYSPTVVLENSLGFLYDPPRLEILFPVLLLQHQILIPKTPQLSYFSILMHSSAKMGPIGRYALLYTKKKRCVDFHKDVPEIGFGGFSSGIQQNIQKAWRLVNTWACQEIIVFVN